jgi:hypothetical protein
MSKSKNIAKKIFKHYNWCSKFENCYCKSFFNHLIWENYLFESEISYVGSKIVIEILLLLFEFQ